MPIKRFLREANLVYKHSNIGYLKIFPFFFMFVLPPILFLISIFTEFDIRIFNGAIASFIIGYLIMKLIIRADKTLHKK